MADLILVRSDTAANWAGVNPILAAGEPGYDTDNGWLKIGDGTTAWLDLPVNNYSTGLTAPNVFHTIPLANSGQTNTTSLATVTGSYFALWVEQLSVPDGIDLYCRACANFSGHTSGDVLGLAVYDLVSAAYAITEGTETAPSGNPVTVRTAWAQVPVFASAWRAEARRRNQTAARGVIRQTWLELVSVPTGTTP